MVKRTYLPILLCLMMASFCLAEKKQIKLKKGDTVVTIVGEVVEQTPEGIKVKQALATVFYPKDQIVSIEAVYDLKEDYADRLSKLKKDDFKSLVKLGRWALENKLYAEAVKHLDAAVKIKSDERAKLLLRQAKAKLEAAHEAKASAGGGNSGSSGGASSAFDTKKMISNEDVQRIRMCELGENDRVTVALRNRVVERFLTQVRGEGDFAEKGADVAFRHKSAAWQAKYIIKHVNADDPLKNDIIIKTDPASMKEFRTNVWRWVSNNCAATACHGSAKGKGGLKLWNVAARGENVDYTNFLILDSFHTKKGLQIIRRDEPEESLLLQYCLPDKQAKRRHPKEINSAFSSRNAGGYKQTMHWILSLKRPLHPAYNLKSNPPHVMKRIDSMSGLPTSTIPPAKKGKDGKDKPKPGKKTEPPF